MTSILDDPEFVPFDLDWENSRVLMLRLSAAQRSTAPFLDQRAIPDGGEGYWVPVQDLIELHREHRHGPDFIFHIGHCGSTLLSRLLEEWTEVQALREPLPLRVLAAHHGDTAEGGPDHRELLSLLLGRWAEPVRSPGRVVIKATSSCNDLIDPILAVRSASRALLLDVGLESYLATVLKAPTSIADAQAAAASRWTFLARRETGKSMPALDGLGVPEMCSLGWLAEHRRFEDLMRSANASRLLRVDFDELLATPREGLLCIAMHMDLDPERVDRVLESPHWSRYSKSSDHGYCPRDRKHDQKLARSRFGGAIDRGREFINSMGTTAMQ